MSRWHIVLLSVLCIEYFVDGVASDVYRRIATAFLAVAKATGGAAIPDVRRTRRPLGVLRKVDDNVTRSGAHSRFLFFLLLYTTRHTIRP
jgi:hypothetical protein